MNRIEVIEVNNKLYKVKRVISHKNINPSTSKDFIQQYALSIGCDRAFLGNGNYYFVEDIDDIDYEKIS